MTGRELYETLSSILIFSVFQTNNFQHHWPRTGISYCSCFQIVNELSTLYYSDSIKRDSSSTHIEIWPDSAVPLSSTENLAFSAQCFGFTASILFYFTFKNTKPKVLSIYPALNTYQQQPPVWKLINIYSNRRQLCLHCCSSRVTFPRPAATRGMFARPFLFLMSRNMLLFPAKSPS